MEKEKLQNFVRKIFDADPQIVHLGIIDLEGNVLLDQSSAATTIMEPDPDRVAFYKQLGVHRVQLAIHAKAATFP